MARRTRKALAFAASVIAAGAAPVVLGCNALLGASAGELERDASSRLDDGGPADGTTAFQGDARTPDEGAIDGTTGAIGDAESDGASGEAASDAFTEAAVDAATRDADGDAAETADPPCARLPCPHELVTRDAPPVADLVLGGGFVFFIDGAGEGAGGVVRVCPKTGCATSSLVIAAPRPSELAVAGGRLIVASSAADALVACPLDGAPCSPQTVLAGERSVSHLAAAGGFLVWSATVDSVVRVRACEASDCAATARTLPRCGAGVRAVATDGGYAFWAAEDGVCRASLLEGGADDDDGGATTPQTTNVATALFARDGRMYYAHLSPTVVARCDAESCVGDHLLTYANLGSDARPGAIASDGTFVYWRDDRTLSISQCRVSGCPGIADTFAVGLTAGPAFRGLAVDATHVYVATGAGVTRVRR